MAGLHRLVQERDQALQDHILAQVGIAGQLPAPDELAGEVRADGQNEIDADFSADDETGVGVHFEEAGGGWGPVAVDAHFMDISLLHEFSHEAGYRGFVQAGQLRQAGARDRRVLMEELHDGR